MDSTQLEKYAKKLLPECQILKFKYRQDLLAKELENEAFYPEVANVLSDIYSAVKDKDLRKYLQARNNLAGRIEEDTLIQSIRYSIASKTSPLTRREVEVLRLLNKGRSLLEVF